MLAIIQARMGSSRLPGKVLYELAGDTVLGFMIKRVKRSRHIDKIVVATSTNIEDEEIVKFCDENKIDIFRGSEKDVLNRFYQCALDYREFSSDVVRLTADCPLVDPEIIDETIRYYRLENVDFCNNNYRPTFPDGFDTAVFSFKALERANNESSLKSDKEHVTAYIIRNSSMANGNIFSSSCYQSTKNNSNIRLTLDEKSDYDLIKIVAEELGNEASLENILKYLQGNNSLLRLNKNIERNEGYKKSLREENEKKI